MGGCDVCGMRYGERNERERERERERDRERERQREEREREREREKRERRERERECVYTACLRGGKPLLLRVLRQCGAFICIHSMEVELVSMRFS